MGKHAFPPLPTRPRLVLAVYLALLVGDSLLYTRQCLSARMSVHQSAHWSIHNARVEKFRKYTFSTRWVFGGCMPVPTRPQRYGNHIMSSLITVRFERVHILKFSMLSESEKKRDGHRHRIGKVKLKVKTTTPKETETNLCFPRNSRDPRLRTCSEWWG